jgi:hypothetical protein
MKPNIEATDIIIRRAANGWIVFSGSEYEADHFIVTVHEEGETEWGEHEALIGLFQEHFDAFTQSKKHGGIKLEVRENGYAFEEDEEDTFFIKAEMEGMDAILDDVLEAKNEAICDVCGRVVDEYETVSYNNLAGVVMCTGKMKDSCKNPICEKDDEG